MQLEATEGGNMGVWTNKPLLSHLMEAHRYALALSDY